MDVEHTAVQTDALLLKDQWAGAFQLQRDSRNGDDGHADDAAHQTADNVHRTLQHTVAQLQLQGAHRDDVASGAAAQNAGKPHGAGLTAAVFLDAVQQQQAEMHGQAHALHLFQHRDEGFAAVHGDVDVDLIQRSLADPIHEVVVVGGHRNTGQRGADLRSRGFQNRHAADALGPVPLQLVN